MIAILEELKALGVDVVPFGDNLVIRPASKVPPELKEQLPRRVPFGASARLARREALRS